MGTFGVYIQVECGLLVGKEVWGYGIHHTRGMCTPWRGSGAGRGRDEEERKLYGINNGIMIEDPGAEASELAN